MRLFFATMLVALSAATANAAVVVFGEVEPFTGPQAYTLDIYAQAVGQSHEIGGFNVIMSLNNPAFSFVTATVPTSVFETPFINNASGNIQLGGTSTASVGLQLAAGQTGLLASVTFNASAPGVAPISLFGTEAIFDQNFETIAATVSGPAQLQPVPAPAGIVGLLSLGIAGVVGAFKRLRCA